VANSFGQGQYRGRTAYIGSSVLVLKHAHKKTVTKQQQSTSILWACMQHC